MNNLYSEAVSHDLTEAEGVKAYLAKTPFVAKDAVRLSGGYGNYTFRVSLVDPASTGRSSIILKHGKAFIPGTEIPISVERTASTNC